LLACLIAACIRDALNYPHDVASQRRSATRDFELTRARVPEVVRQGYQAGESKTEPSTTQSSGESNEDLAHSIGHLGYRLLFHDGEPLQQSEHRATEEKVITTVRSDIKNAADRSSGVFYWR
jgi:hypothetical protein